MEEHDLTKLVDELFKPADPPEGAALTQHLAKQRAGALRYLGPPRPGPLHHPPT